MEIKVASGEVDPYIVYIIPNLCRSGQFTACARCRKIEHCAELLGLRRGIVDHCENSISLSSVDCHYTVVASWCEVSHRELVRASEGGLRGVGTRHRVSVLPRHGLKGAWWHQVKEVGQAVRVLRAVYGAPSEASGSIRAVAGRNLPRIRVTLTPFNDAGEWTLVQSRI